MRRLCKCLLVAAATVYWPTVDLGAQDAPPHRTADLLVVLAGPGAGE
ncbi:MAG TPA: hypothetical protein VE869_08395 [Gemmatimonas sp.]|nr:hypothetical protein [Gemmatimonas sp.]